MRAEREDDRHDVHEQRAEYARVRVPRCVLDGEEGRVGSVGEASFRRSRSGVGAGSIGIGKRPFTHRAACTNIASVRSEREGKRSVVNHSCIFLAKLHNCHSHISGERRTVCSAPKKRGRLAGRRLDPRMWEARKNKAICHMERLLAGSALSGCLHRRRLCDGSWKNASCKSLVSRMSGAFIDILNILGGVSRSSRSFNYV